MELFGKKYGFAKNQKAIDVCHGLIDLFMTRQFCTAVSWSGQARSANVSQKINFSANKKLIEAFSNVVALASIDSSDAAIQSFFSSSVFRNANARLNHKKYRTATTTATPPAPRKRKHQVQQAIITDTTDAPTEIEPQANESIIENSAEKMDQNQFLDDENEEILLDHALNQADVGTPELF